MDELTIGDKIYVSSKKAAKITGYTKDYVGQMCREGRVEARLVGRNWYVLESSLMEHRFGAEEAVQEEDGAPVEDSEPEEKEDVWLAPTYKREEPVLVPPLIAREPDQEQAKQVVSDMQTAWQEWFSTQKDAPKNLPDGSEDFTPDTLPAIVEEEEVILTRVHESVNEEKEIPEEFQPAEQVPLTIHREERIETPVQERKIQSEEVIQEEPAKQPVGRGLPMRTMFIAAAGLAVCVALIGTGAVGELSKVSGVNNGPQKAVAEYLSGESTYKSLSK
mgnify:CR=1 FL=1